ncbi:peptidase [Chitinophaga pendula]|uniref:LexA family protein n=1 Tax=Chitinophaga TaxID=79328 RepID=UPI000BAFF103|nr:MULTISPECIES: S24 family peptidase [Chitinophaga]ASZ11063.1 peptidase [Chitinophaga sp. MD30]UCJ05939.1 peptidase [Chitinophaga pendula]
MMPLPVQDYFEEEVDVANLLGVSPQQVFRFEMTGPSMEEANIPNGAILIIDRTVKPNHGDIILATLNGEYTVRRLVKIHAGWVLHPENHAYTPHLIREGDEFEVWGVVKTVVIRLK